MTKQENIFAEAVDRQQAGEPLEAILQVAENDADWLLLLLEQTTAVSQLHAQLPILGQAENEITFLAQAERMQAKPKVIRLIRWRKRPFAYGLSFAFTLLLFFFGGGLFLSLADNAHILPDHPLYSYKRLGEETLLRLPQSVSNKQQWQDSLATRRREEVQLMQLYQREAAVSFSGVVEEIDGHQVVVSGILCPLSCRHQPRHEVPPTQIVGLLNVGAAVQVDAQTLADGSLHINRIVVQEVSKSS